MDRESVKQKFSIIGEDAQLNRAIDIAIQVASTEVTVLVVGENGTGKDVFSRIIHQLSPRKHAPFIAINCGAIPEGTIDSELFGHEKGAFTSAFESRRGYFEEVNGGSIFLDEIAEMPLSTQSRLLRVLENGEFLRVGSSKVNKTDVRVIAATNHNLVEAIREHKFREDLYFRLNTVTIHVPPLRDRGDDISLLFRYFAQEFAEQYRRKPVRLSDEAESMLYKHHWPGNVRELRNFVEKLSVLSQSELITPDELQNYLALADSRLPVLFNQFQNQEEDFQQTTNGTWQQDPFAQAPQAAPQQLDVAFLYRILYELKNEISEIKYSLKNLEEDYYFHTPSYSAPNEVVYQQPVYSHRRYRAASEAETTEEQPQLFEESLSLEQKEQDLIAKALRKHNHNRKKAAQELGISERTLYRKIKSYGLDE